MKTVTVLVAALLLSSTAYAEKRLAMKETRKVEPSKQRVEPKAPAKQLHRKQQRSQTPAEYQLEHPQLG